MTLSLIFAILALLCFAASAAGIPSRVGLMPLGLVFVVLMLIVGGAP
jgi:hypothetical protein